ncbi:MAG: hypothetical protein KatS3mg038_1121 [Candidatus Kapaibacterium sp.]|nr:MAG: hypothetical protein KatS3mg038_1121 [Candidatus Kapabacteria bacterium]
MMDAGLAADALQIDNRDALEVIAMGNPSGIYVDRPTTRHAQNKGYA